MFKFDADTPLTDQGTWAEFSGSKFLIAHISNLKFQRTLSKLQQPHRRKIETGSLDPKINKEIICRAMSEGIILDWSGVVSSSGDSTPYSPEAGYTALIKNVEFRDWVSEFSVNLSNFRAEEIEEVGKP
jgi:hypothetical protein